MISLKIFLTTQHYNVKQKSTMKESVQVMLESVIMIFFKVLLLSNI